MDSAFIQKLVWAVLGIGTYVLSTWPPVAAVADPLKLAAGGMLTSPWFSRPGDGKLIAAGKEAIRKSIAPAALVSLVSHAAAMSIAFGVLAACAGTPTPREAIGGAKRAQESLEHVCAELERTKPLREEVTDAVDTLAPAGVDGGAPADADPVQPAEAPVAQ